MQQLYFATANKWKFHQAADYFEKHGIQLRHFGIELPESRNEDVLVIAKEKAKFAFDKLRRPVFVWDGAFHIKALNDFPKTYVKFAEKYLGAKGILKLLKGVKDRKWEYVNLIYYKDKNREKHFTGIIKGTFVKKMTRDRNSKVRDFERIQVPEEHTKTFTQMSDKEFKSFFEEVWKPTVYDEFILWFSSTFSGGTKKNQFLGLRS